MEKPTLSDLAIFYLSEVRKWARFIAIFSFIMLGLMVIMGLFMGLVLNSLSSMASKAPMPFPPAVFAIIYIAIAIVYFFPVYYLYRFSVDIGNALASGSEEVMTSAFRFLKSHYKYIGLLLIISLFIGILGFFAAIIGGIFGFFNAAPETQYF